MSKSWKFPCKETVRNGSAIVPCKKKLGHIGDCEPMVQVQK